MAKDTKDTKGSSLQAQLAAKQVNGVSLAIFFVLMALSAVAAILVDSLDLPDWLIGAALLGLNLIGISILFALKIANQWEKAVVLRFGKFRGLRGPGLFWIVPVVDNIPIWIDHRVMVTPFNAEKTLTKDTVPVDVDAVLFWVVWDAQKAALEVENYRAAIAWSAQTALRDIIGKMMLADILVGREMIDKELQKIIDERTTPWGVSVSSVEIRDIVIPPALEDAMSRQAQAERERQARVILGESEKQIASSFAEAAQAYRDNPTALHLRAMNMLFEGLKEKGALVIVPSSAVDTMNLGGLSGLTALAKTAGSEQK
ncbi:MAG: peptidase [Chloroflexi bacterium RBG_16_63_12]|nr:MAG: peptidase [Chloroflexi bacterium RBG_16_63_12]